MMGVLPQNSVRCLVRFSSIAGLVFLMSFGQFLSSCYRASRETALTQHKMKRKKKKINIYDVTLYIVYITEAIITQTIIRKTVYATPVTAL